MQYYKRELLENVLGSYRCLTTVASISVSSNKKAVIYFESGVIIPPKMDRGHGRSGVGQLIGLEMCHYEYIFRIYLKIPECL